MAAEATTAKVHALLAACVAVSRSASLLEPVGSNGVQTDPVLSVPLELGLAQEDREFWDTLSEREERDDGRSNTSLLEDIGVLIASVDVPADKISQVMRVLLLHPSFHSQGIVRLAHSIFRGLKLAKRWDVLMFVSTQLSDAVHAKVLADDTTDQGLHFWVEILVGYQHTGELFERVADKLVALVELFGGQASDHHDAQAIERASAIFLACTALIHYHRGYESEASKLCGAIEKTFAGIISPPTTADAEKLLRESAWVLSPGTLGKYFPSIEGKWLADEFSNENLAPGSSSSRNGGSVLFKKVSNCFAHDVTATIELPGDKNSTLELQGYLLQELPSMQALLSSPESLSSTPWTMEGHWRQVQSGDKVASQVAPVATTPSPDWDCHACTMKNEGTATRCATCGTDRPAGAVTTVTTQSGSNPAPFSAVFDSTFSFLRMKWSRGEQQGVWLARRESAVKGFDLRVPLQAMSDMMTDSPVVPMHVFSPRGKGANVLVLERSLLTSTSHQEYTIQAWIRPEEAPVEAEQQVVFANGHEFELTMTSSGVLVWQLAGGRYTIMSESPLEFGKFYHVTLTANQAELTMLINQQVVGKTQKTPEPETYGPVPSNGAALFTIGGSFDTANSSSTKWGKASFHGAIIDLRIWSAVASAPCVQEHSVSSALNGREPNLIGYFPLVGKLQRLLMDYSSYENHANVFEAYQFAENDSKNSVTAFQSSFAPTVGLQDLPVKNLFSVSLVDEFLGSGTFSLDSTNGLLVQSGAALWYRAPVEFAATHGFETRFSLELGVDTSGSDTVIFAMGEASYWNLSPLLPEAASTTNDASLSRASDAFTFSDSALLVKICAEKDSSSAGRVMYSLGVYVISSKRQYALSRVFRVAGGDGAQSADVRIAYALPQRVISIDLGGGKGVVFDCAVDLERVLQLKQNSTVRTGLVFPSSDAASHATPRLTRLTSWTLTSVDPSGEMHDGDVHLTGSSILESVYGSLGSTRSKEKPGNSASVDTDGVTCSRVANDGSAVEQEMYGCQTCELVHDNSICRACAILCHEGHELVAMGVIKAACGCRARHTGACRCETAVKKADHPQLDRPVQATRWRCSKCTVVNGMDTKQCSICGNSAPPTGTDPAPVLSSSRALVLVEPKPTAPPATEWACGACTMLNVPEATKCSICDTPRPGSAEKKAGEAEEKKEDGLAALYSAATTTPVSNSSWICSACTMENSATDTTCHMCSTTRVTTVADSVDTTDVVVGIPLEKGTVGDPIRMDVDGASGNANAPRVATQQPASTQPSNTTTTAENTIYLHGYKRTVAQAMNQTLNVDTLKNSVWETTAGAMTIGVNDSFVGEYIHGTYLERDGTVYGLAKVAENGSWRLDGRFKKYSQSQENACVLQWDQAASQFDGKWYRGDGSGDWKCVYSPYVADFRGLKPIETTPANGAAAPLDQLQPFYLGLLNMKENLTNVCYQNSFIQTLYMTRAFRQMILSVDSGMVSADTVGPVNSGQTLSRIQELFARLTSSQRPYLDTHALQRCLPPDFVSGRQQDTSDFAHFLIDALGQEMEALNGGDLDQPANHHHAIADIFGGHQATILACKACGKTSVNREYFWELLLNMIDLRYTPITDIAAVSGSSSMDIKTPAGFERLNSDLNKDRSNAPYIYLCLKRCPERDEATAMDEEDEKLQPITDLVVKVVPAAGPKPTVPGYDRVELDLNLGGSAPLNTGGKKQVYLFYRRERDGSPITDLQVVYGNDAVPDGFKTVQIDLNQGDGTRVYLCYRCDMPITDLKIVNGGIPGYRMVDHLLNLSHNDAVKQYLALKVGGHEPCLTDLKLVNGNDVAEYLEAGWQSIGSPMPFDTDLPAGDAPPQLLVRRGHGNPIFAIDVFRAPRQVPKYNDYEVIDLYPRSMTPAVAATSSDEADDSVMTAAASAPALEGDWMGTEITDRLRKAVRIRSVSSPLSNALLIKGEVEDKGEIVAVAVVRSGWSESVMEATPAPSDDSTAAPTPPQDRRHMYHLMGYWRNSKTQSAQLFDVELRPTANSADEAGASLYSLDGTIGDGKGKPMTIRGVQTSRTVKIKWPIADIFVIRGDERVPEGVQVLRETCSGRSGNLLAQTNSPYTLYLAVKREAAPAQGYVSDVCVIYGEIDTVPDGYMCVQTTPAGHSANLNDGTTGVPVFLCYRRHGAPSQDEADATTKSIMDLALMWTSGAQTDTLPSGFTKIQHTPLGMEANLNQGTTGVAIHLCFAKCETRDIVQPLVHALNGEFELTSAGSAPAPAPACGRFVNMAVVEELRDVREVEGSFGTVLHGYLHGGLRGVLFESSTRVVPHECTLLGTWNSDGGNGAATMTDFVPPNHPFLLAFDAVNAQLDGWWSGPDTSAAGASASTPSAAAGVGKTTPSASPKHASQANSKLAGLGEPWRIVKDAYVRIAFKKDYGTEWQDGKLVFSERVWQHDMTSMLRRFVATRTLGGDNALSCSACGTKTESRAHTVIIEPPEHLVITLKRMSYDWTAQKALKCLHDVRFSALLTLPSLSEEEEEQVADKSAEGDRTPTSQHHERQYGLYGVLVHSGLTANSGHYYSFCRESDEHTHELHLEDSTLAPWIKFNDTKVERSNWHEIQRHVSNAVADTVYLLLYKKLHYTIPEVEESSAVGVVADDTMETVSVSGDEEEAMLLAKAMALSMAAATKQQQQQREAAADTVQDEETKQEEEEMRPAADDIGNASQSVKEVKINKTIIKQVEVENASFLEDTLAATSSRVHYDDLHTLVSLRRSMPLQLHAVLADLTPSHR